MPEKTVLIVEDEPSVADLLKFLLEKDGYSISIAFDGEEAINSVRSNKPDLILLEGKGVGERGQQPNYTNHTLF